MTHWVPELLSPAGSLEKLKVAVSYGADAVYLGGQKFGLRQAADNFTASELREGTSYAHQRGAKVYVVLNSFLYDDELKDLPSFLKLLEEIKVDAVIVSDLGVIQTVLDNCSVDVHLSTQASCLNKYAAKVWKDIGVTRIVLGREVSIEEAKKIKRESGLEMEMFIHGSMCMAYSGNCTISNYTQGRDSNRGGCAHSCRFEYSIELEGEKEKKYAHFMSSKDLEGVRLVEDFIKAGIDSLKVEGRMKSHHYAGTVSKVYGEALSYYKENGHFLSDDIYTWEKELCKVSHRDYHSGNLIQKAGDESIFSDREHADSDYSVAGIVLENNEKLDYMLAEVRSPFLKNSELELVPFQGPNININLSEIIDVSGESFDKSRPGMVIKLPFMKNASSYNMLRVRK
jgi:putative protease